MVTISKFSQHVKIAEFEFENSQNHEEDFLMNHPNVKSGSRLFVMSNIPKCESRASDFEPVRAIRFIFGRISCEKE